MSHRLPLLGHALELWRHPLELLCATTQFGPIVRLDLGGWPVYIVTEPELVHQLLVDYGASTEKGRLFQRARAFVGCGLTTSDGELHRQQRRLVQPAFHRSRLPGYSRIMTEAVRQMLDSWRDGQTVDIDTAMYALTVTTVTKAMFSIEVGQHAVTEVQLLLPEVANGLFTRTLLPATLSRLPLPANRRFDGAVARLRAVVDELIVEARCRPAEQLDERADLLSILASARDIHTGQPMSHQQLRDEAITIMMSGTETTAVTLAWVCHELANAPEVLDRLRVEIDLVRDEDGTVAYDRLANLAYTGWALREVMRLHAIPLVMRRTTAAIRLGGITFPAGTELAYSPYAQHRDPRYFRDPSRFDPDRWSSGGASSGTYTPFGTGKRKCVGDTFAWTELLIALTAIIADWNLRPGDWIPRERISASIPRPDALPMLVTKRRIPVR
jgi:cytochrome P450